MHDLRPPRHRSRLSALIAFTGLASASLASADVVYEQTFSNGLGGFSASGSVYTGSYGVRMRGGNSDGTITSPVIDASGFTSLTLSVNRATSGLDLGEAGVISVSLNGGTFTTIESLRTASGRVTLQLGSSAQSLRVRFAVDASSFYETYEVSSLVIEGTPDGGGCEPDCEPPPPGTTDPGTGPWRLVPSSNVAAECGLDPALLQAANRTLNRAWAVVRHGKLCHEFYPSGSDPADDIYSSTKTMGALTIGALIHQTRSIPETTTRKRGPLKEFQRVDHWLDSFTFNRDSTVAHVLAMVGGSRSLAYGSKTWAYDTVGSTAINRLSDVVNTVVVQDPDRLGRNIGEFWTRHLAQPLGLENSRWGTSQSSKSFATSWVSTVRDMARVGLLMVNGGVWNGQRLIDVQFLYNQIHAAFEDANTGYGYLTWLNEDDSCAPKPVHRTYPHGISQAPSCLRAEGCSQTYDAGVFYAAGLGGQYIIGHRGLDLVIAIKDTGGQSGSEPARVWQALRPALLAHDPVYRGNESGFCNAYGRGNYAPNLKLWEGGR